MPVSFGIMKQFNEKLKDIKRQIDELEFNLRVCSKHTQFMHEMSCLTSSDKAMSADYERQMGQDAYKRMALQDKLRKLIKECYDLEYKLSTGDNGSE